MELTTSISQYRENWIRVGKRTDWLNSSRNRSLTEWTIDQLQVEPYQHILQVGYGAGYALEEAARRLKVGFLAGIDESISMYRKAYARNKRLIRQQLLQLHFGGIHELAYPHHYFHTIFGSNAHHAWKHPAQGFFQLANLLKPGGKLVMVFQPAWARSEEEVMEEAEKTRLEFREAGLSRVQLEYRDLHPVTGVAVTGYKD